MPEKLRIRFSKTGRAIWLSHLDLMRTMQRAFLRAGYPLKYSEGFNPHAQISILLPLSVGVSSVCELMDFQLRDDVDLAELPSRLTIVITRKTKRGEGEMDIVPAIRELSIATNEESGFITMNAVISAQEPTLNPDHLIAALRQQAPELTPDFAAFTRQQVYFENGAVFR